MLISIHPSIHSFLSTCCILAQCLPLWRFQEPSDELGDLPAFEELAELLSFQLQKYTFFPKVAIIHMSAVLETLGLF